ncbi:hypothetical protein MGYG_08781 [Nannizzia gypsea CBS 118893]|uniref:Uncharacterized protein n=1 Tax=Arthroderma gypseum (strain ATCC MYA-4604 / CBS 118893) TaxID=535722 RepID=E4V6Z5_ARTGP|nr:hypothetical protein MGYG_08781 [Nannizzia gypsea CBS 118893]EFQ96861.1 hypothetical protein MGYG_08781 [Nannizzia gypsea CBS 118893]
MTGAHTLPKDFTFFSPTESEPRTPDRPLRDLSHPPRPHHTSHRVRRRRMERKPIPFSAPDVPLPSIELSRISPPESTSESQSTSGPAFIFQGCGGYLDVPRRQRTDPKTPPAQIRDLASQSFENGAADGTTTPVGASISRPSSACSHASDSSFSSTSAASFDSFDSFISFGGSCTSPETEIDDPFLAVSLPDNKNNLDTPSKSVKNTPVIPANLSQNQRWTSEMDQHLWNTYQIHLQDPTITPFKMLPGSLPPLGVSHRVAREARRAWVKAKQQQQPQSQSQSQSQSESQPSESQSSQSSETANSASKNTPQWPRSDAVTRRRLKELCKRKYSIAPHYQRLLESRSPSPPPDLLTSYTTTAVTPVSAPFTRDLGISLVSGTMPSDPPEAASTPNIISNTVSSVATTGNDDDIPRLGSPFMYHTWGPSNTRRVSQADTTPVKPTVETHDTVHVTGSRLRSGIAPDLFTPTNNNQRLPEVTVPADTKDQTPARVRIRTRNRGLTTSSSSSSHNSNMLNINSRHRLIQLFTPPSGSGSTETDGLTSHGQTHSPEIEGERIKRLGSPFNLDLPASKRPQPHPRQYNRPRHAPSRSDTFLMHPPIHVQGQPFFSTLSSAPDLDASDTERAPAPATALHSPKA